MNLALSATIQHERRTIAWASSHLAGTEASIRRLHISYSINIPISVSTQKKAITYTVYYLNEDILITADSGIDSMLVIWDARTGLPKKTIMDPHPNGVEALDVSPDGQLIVTLSKES